MNPLVKKEIRLLLPAWIAAMLLAVLPTWIASVWSYIPPQETSYVPLAFALGILFLGIASFGQEFSFGTFSVLLSQPMERRRVWLIKTMVLGVAFVSVLLALVVSRELYAFRWPARATAVLPEFGFLALSVAVMFSGGLWTTLLLRRTSEAFWLTLLTPLAIMVALYGLHVHFHWSNQINNNVIPTVLLLYSLAGFFWARRLFLHAQDTQWTGGEIAFLSRKKISQRTTISYRPGRWLSTLVWKELQLHQVNILIAGVVLALDLASVIIRKFHPHFADPNVKGLLLLVWVLWLLMPLLIGSAAVAEEHRSGTFESQLCLPVSRRTQFFVKFSVALFLSLLLGGVMPLAIERMLDINLWILVVAAAIFFISFYASTVARTTLQAIGATIIIAVAIYFYEAATAVTIFRLGARFPFEPAYLPAGFEPLKLYLGIPILLLTLSGLTYWNLKWLHPGGKLWWRNSIAILVTFALIFACINGVYFRVWEFLTPVEPPHGPTRLSALTPPRLIISRDTLSVLRPDGRLWTETLAYDEHEYTKDRMGWSWKTLAPDRCKARFIGGSNWTRVATDPYRIVGIQSGGSLWTIQTYPERSGYPLTQIGTGTNWSQVAGGLGFLLLKKKGTLWFWGADGRSLSPENLKKYLTMPPVRISTDTNWVDVFGRWARKRDGSVWISGFTRRKTNAIPQLEEVPTRNEWMGFTSRTSEVGWTVEIKTNNKLWLIAHPPVEEHQPIPKTEKFQLAKRRKWITAMFTSDNSVIALRSDGTLWKWPQFYWARKSLASPNWTLYPKRPDLIKPVQVGTYSGWIALHPMANDWQGASIALAADGSLWVWGEPSRYIWLAPPRKPVYLGNIFKPSN